MRNAFAKSEHCSIGDQITTARGIGIIRIWLLTLEVPPRSNKHRGESQPPNPHHLALPLASLRRLWTRLSAQLEWPGSTSRVIAGRRWSPAILTFFRGGWVADLVCTVEEFTNAVTRRIAT